MIEVVKVRLREGGKIQDYDTNQQELKLGARVIVPTADGLTLGTVVSNPQRLDEQYVKATFRAVVRCATAEDEERVRAHQEQERTAYRLCVAAIARMHLQMKLVEVEYLFEGGKAVFYFTADGRVDFRQLVKELAHECRIRIEMRQIGVRDEARMIGGYGICGRELCCASFLSEFEPISIRMAKDQDLPLSPGKVSGVCGRLMCCLGYETRVYEDFKRGLPKIGEKIRLAEGVGRVRKYNLFEDAFTVELEGGEYLKVRKEDWNRARRPDEAPAGGAPPPDEAAPAPAAERRPGGQRPERPAQGGGGRDRRERGGRRGGQQGGRRPDRGGRGGEGGAAGGAGGAGGSGPKPGEAPKS
jgi:cell fate regulator YaaT (PSP1 superfamily)